MWRNTKTACAIVALALAACEEASPPHEPPPDGCAPSGTTPMVHDCGWIGHDETWAAADGPHLVTRDTTVDAAATLTIEPGAEVRMEARVSLLVRGALRAQGEPDRPVLFTGAALDPWSSLQAVEGGSLWLADTRLEGGGAPTPLVDASESGSVMVEGDRAGSTQGLLHAERLVVAGSASVGIVLDERAGFDDTSNAVTVTGAAMHPMRLWATELGTIPDGAYSGNGEDAILLEGIGGPETITRSTTVHDRGVPYQLGTTSRGGRLTIDGGADGVATLTIDAGVVFRMGRASVIEVETEPNYGPARGEIVAVGTEEKPIVFTSLAEVPAAGDWLGLYFWSAAGAHDRLDHVVIEWAGGDAGIAPTFCGTDELGGSHPRSAAIRLLGGFPETPFLTASTIAHSPEFGIDRGDPPTDLDFAVGNTFEDIWLCPQSSRICPHPPACP